MIDRDKIVQELQFELKERLNYSSDVQLDKNPTSEYFVRLFLQSLEDLNYVVVPKHIQADTTHVYNFEDAIVRWNAREDLQPEDVNGQQILQSLVSDGWLILPPF